MTISIRIFSCESIIGVLSEYARSTRIELKISHEELSHMIGTTRPRISLFMQRFRNLGLIELSEEHYLIVKEDKLTAYLASIA